MKQAVSVWTRGHTLHIQFDGHEISMPVELGLGRLLTIMRARDIRENANEKHSVATPSAPVQLDAYDPATKDGVTSRIKKEAAELRARNALMRRVNKRVGREQAEKDLAAAGM
jgi:hypothetical protein